MSINDRDRWKDATSKPVFLYLNFEKNLLRIADMNETSGGSGEVLYANHPNKYDKYNLCNLCYDLNLQKITFLSGDTQSIPPQKSKGYLELLSDFKNTDAKRLIFLLRKTGSKKILRLLGNEDILFLAKFNELQMILYQYKTNETEYIPAFTSKEELDYFLGKYKNSKEHLSLCEYEPLCIKLKKGLPLIKKRQSIHINPVTFAICGKNLEITLNSKILANI